MVHRDPETGQFRAHDDDRALSYTDHEFVNVRLNLIHDGSTNDRAGTEYKVEDDVLGLDNDELAQLSFLAAALDVTYEGFDEGSGDVTRGTSQVNVEIGANLSSSEYLSQAEVNTGVQETDTDSSVNSFATRATDEPGLWAALLASANGGFKDYDPDGSYSGGSTTGSDRMRRLYPEETMGGPYIDSTDDITIGVYNDKTDQDSATRIQVYAQMAFVIYEYDQRRAEFGPVPGGT